MRSKLFGSFNWYPLTVLLVNMAGSKLSCGRVQDMPAVNKLCNKTGVLQQMDTVTHLSASVPNMTADVDIQEPWHHHQWTVLLWNPPRPSYCTLASPCDTVHTVQDMLHSMCWKVLRHPPNSPDLSVCIFHVFSTLKIALKGCRFGSDTAVIPSSALKFFIEEIQWPVHQWDTFLNTHGDYF